MKFLLSRSGQFVLCCLSGILLSLSWPSGGFAPLLLIALVPILFVEDCYSKQIAGFGRWNFFFNTYFTFFTFNLLTTWWVKYASLFGAVAAIFFNALFLTIVFCAAHVAGNRVPRKLKYAPLIVFWLAFEHLHMDWDLSWPWLTLGNGFAGWIRTIQWYEFTGVLGGSLWIWVVNILVYMVFNSVFITGERNKVRKRISWLVAIIVIPLCYSFVRFYTYMETVNPVSIGVIQPNIDPYNEKFSGMTSNAQLKRILDLASKVADTSTDYIVAPETALPDGIWEEELNEHPQVEALRNFIKPFPHANWVIGLASNKLYPDSNQRSTTARKFTDAPGYYDSYNTAMQVNHTGDIQIHHKSKLVPGVEKMPFPAIFKHLDNFAIDLGGITGSLGVQEVPSVFKSNDRVVAPVICYESIYGDYLSQYIRQGAQLIFIITNDGWWSDTPGYRQHLKYATLRAIETRRSIARSANTGISCFINQRGEISQATKWWTPDAIKATLNANNEMTFYARFGDYLGTIASLGCLAIVLLVIFRKRVGTF